MISRELNLVSFNSQTQMNNDWLVSKKDDENNKFQNVLETKAETILKKNKVDNLRFEKKEQQIQKEVDRPIRKEDTPEVVELRKKLKEVLGRKKIDQDKDSAPKQEVIETSLEALLAELGLVNDENSIDMLAELLGMTTEDLMEQLTSDTTDLSSLATKIAELLTDNEVLVEPVIKGLREMLVKLEADDQVKFESFIEDIVKELPEGEVKDSVTKFQNAVQMVIDNQVKSDGKEKDVAVSSDKLVDEDMTKTDKVVNVESQSANDGESTEKNDTQSKEPMANINAKVTNTSLNQEFNIQDQINIMKQGGDDVIVDKVSPKAMLTRSVMSQVVQGTKMSINMADHGNEIVVKLNPKNLGNVALKMAFDKGQLIAQIQVENNTVKSIIESNLDDLRGALKEEGYDIGELDVSVAKDDTQEEHHQQQFGQRKAKVDFETFEEIEEKIQMQKATREGIDYLA